MSLSDLREERYLDTDQDIDVDLNALIGELKPNLLTPHLEELVKANPAARGNPHLFPCRIGVKDSILIHMHRRFLQRSICIGVV